MVTLARAGTSPSSVGVFVEKFARRARLAHAPENLASHRGRLSLAGCLGVVGGEHLCGAQSGCVGDALKLGSSRTQGGVVYGGSDHPDQHGSSKPEHHRNVAALVAPESPDHRSAPTAWILKRQATPQRLRKWRGFASNLSENSPSAAASAMR